MASVGSKLNKAREAKRLSLEEVSQRTKIRPNVLEAIEEDRAEEILSKVYVKGFVKSFAQVVGLNGELLVQEYLEKPEGGLPETPPPSEVSWEEEEESSPWLFRILVAILVIGGLYGIGWGLSKIPWKASSISPRQELLSKKGTLIPYPFRLSKDESLKLELRAIENTWMTVRSDGQLMYQGLLSKGNEEMWVAQSRFELSLSDGGAVQFRLGRKSLGIPGEKGRPLERLLMTHEGWGIGVQK